MLKNKFLIIYMLTSYFFKKKEISIKKEFPNANKIFKRLKKLNNSLDFS